MKDGCGFSTIRKSVLPKFPFKLNPILIGALFSGYLTPCNGFDEALFDSELEWCFDDLEFIKTSRVNPLEMLFEAEKALEQSNNSEQQNSNSTETIFATSKQFSTNKNFELLDDPIALMKRLKQERGI